MTAARPKLAPVPSAPKPKLRRVTMKRALELWITPENARKYLRAIVVLRTKTRNGWKRDQPVQRIPKEKQ